jgi:hypothetical protein
MPPTTPQKPDSILRHKANKFAHLIDLDHWDQLRVIGRQRDLDTSDIDRDPRPPAHTV